MPRYRKKTVEIDAELIVAGMQGDLLAEAIAGGHARTDDLGQVIIETLEGAMMGRPGDWLIKGVDGEFYPCKPHIFAKTYEPL